MPPGDAVQPVRARPTVLESGTQPNTDSEQRATSAQRGPPYKRFKKLAASLSGWRWRRRESNPRHGPAAEESGASSNSDRLLGSKSVSEASHKLDEAAGWDDEPLGSA
jgi:hypothetical protein